MTIADALVATKFANTRGEARRLAAQGGVWVNGVNVSDVDQPLEESLLASGDIDLRVGRRRAATFKAPPELPERN